MTPPVKKRIAALDGLRTLAIIGVMFTHLPFGPLYGVLPVALHPFLAMILGSGGIAVHIFFLLTGFLMAKLHPAATYRPFIARRYGRLLPAFLVMAGSLAVLDAVGAVPVWMAAGIVLAGILVAWGLWRVYRAVSQRTGRFGTWLLYGWLMVQGLTAFWYVFYLLRVQPAVFYEVWPASARNAAVAAVNITMTLPFGNYIKQLDGVYWAITAEVLFYHLYPLVIVPIALFLAPIPRKRTHALLIAALVPFCFGLAILSKRFLGFDLVKPHLIIYFLTGVIVGYGEQYFRRALAAIRPLLLHPLWNIGIALVVLGETLVYGNFSGEYHSWVSVVFAVPTGIFLLTLLDKNSPVAHILGSWIFSSVGKYSYALFLVHSFVIGQVLRFMSADSVGGSIAVAAVVFTVSGVLAFLLFHLVEKQYTMHTTASKLKKQNAPSFRSTFVYARLTGLTVGIIAVSYFAYKPPAALFTWVYRHGVSAFPTARNSTNTTIGETPIRQDFEAKENGLGMVLVSIRNRENPDGKRGGFVPSQLIALLNNQNGEQHADSRFPAYQIIDSPYHPFGFPVIADSGGKRYSLILALDKEDPGRTVVWDTSEGELLTVYFADKRMLVKNPVRGVWWLLHKIGEPLENPAFSSTLLFFAPFLLLLWYAAASVKAANPQKVSSV